MLLLGGSSSAQTLDATRIVSLTHDLASTSGTYTLDLTSTGLGDAANMRAVIVEMGKGGTVGTPANGVAITVGMSDGISSHMVAIRSQNNLGTAETANRCHNDAIGVWMNDTADTGLLEIRFGQWIEDGVQLSLTQTAGTPPAGLQLNVTIIAGPDVAVDLLQNSTSATVGGSKIISPSYSTETSFVLCLAEGAFDAVSDGADAGARISWGCSTNDGAGAETNQCVLWGTTDSPAGNSDPFCAPMTTRCMQMGTSAALAGGALIENYQSNGDFDLTTQVIGTQPLAMLAVSLPVDVHLESMDTKASGGTDIVTTPGFEPQALLFCGTAMTVTDLLNGSNPAGTFGLSSFSYDSAGAIVGYGHSVSEANNQATTNSQTVAGDNTNGWEVPFHLGTDACIVRITSFDSTGYTVEYDAAPAAPRKWWVLAIEQEPTELAMFDEEVAVSEEVLHVLLDTLSETVTIVEALLPLLSGGADPIEVLSEQLTIQETLVPILGEGQAVATESVTIVETLAYALREVVTVLVERQRPEVRAGATRTTATSGGGAGPIAVSE